MTTAVIDGDILAYSAAAANEQRSVCAAHNTTAEKVSFKTATDFKIWCNDEGFDAGDFTLSVVQEAGEEVFAYSIMKQTIERACEKIGADSYHVVISGKNNFRLDLPLPTRYKSNRKDSVRPLQLENCRQYLLKFQNAEMSDGVEADDLLAGYAAAGYRDKDVILLSRDKDLRIGECLFYDWSKEENVVEDISGLGSLILTETPTAKLKADGTPQTVKSVKGSGRIFLTLQILQGDLSDGYKPSELAKKSFGAVGAYNLLHKCKTDKEAWEAVVRQYKLWYPKPVKYRCWNDILHEKNWMQILQMYVDCAYMRKIETQGLDVKKLLDKLKISYE